MSVKANEMTLMLNRWKNGDEASGHELLEEIDPRLREMLATRLAKRGGVANRFRVTEFLPAIQERLNKQRKTDWKNRAQFFAVIYRIVGYVVSDATRGEERGCRDWRKETSIEQDGKVAVDVASSANPSFQVEVRLALESLSNAYPTNYEILMAHAVDERSCAELAREYGCEVLEIRKKITFSRAYLRRHTNLQPPPSPGVSK
jgi:DNA-directed RNA polymerase specialized sigma24 family protein